MILRILTISACICIASAAALADEASIGRTFHAAGAQFQIIDDALDVRIEATEAAPGLHVAIDAEGRLAIDEAEIELEGRERKLLRKFVRELDALGALIEIVGASVAVQQDANARDQDREHAAKSIAKTGKKVEKQYARLAGLAAQLHERVPALEVLLERFAQ